MNIHPVFVHFPVAFLTIYALLELLRFKKLLALPYWFYVKAVLVIAGSLGTAAALYTGDDAAHIVIRSDKSIRPLVHMHENFADWTTAIFAVLAVSYLILWLNRENIQRYFKSAALQKIWVWKYKFANFFVETPFVLLLALAGLILITITGGLGGVITYGPNADPFFHFIYKLLFP